MAAIIGKSTLAGIVNGMARYGTRLIMVPVVIGHLGLGGYGIWSIILTTASYMRFGSAGIRSAFQKYVAEATGNGDFERASRLVSTGSITMLVLSAIGLIPLALFSPRLAEAIGVPPESTAETAASMAVLACTYILCNFGAGFEAIVMGGHRIHVLRQFNSVLQIAEAIAIITVLHCGHGLFAMTLVMGASELIYLIFCWIVSHRVLPEMRIDMMCFTTTVFPELVRFAGSYQLLNMMELVYGAILPIAVLKMFGAGAAGVYAVSVRAVSMALTAQEALVLPILSGGTMVFASGSPERRTLFLEKSFKATVAVALPPLAFVCAFSTTLVLAWTGEADSRFRVAVWLAAIAGLLNAISLLQSILYRASGKALLDSIRQVLRIVVLLITVWFGRRIGFVGLLAGMAGAELAGGIVMCFATATTFPAFSARILARDALRITAATALITSAGVLAETASLPWAMAVRLAAMTRLAQIALGCLIAVWPVMILTKPISTAERRTVLDALMPGRTGALATSE